MGFHDECGVFGVYGHPEASNLTYLGLHALQHRGQEAAGIVTSDKERLYAHRQLGLVQDVFSQDRLNRLPGESAIGHVRYSTTGEGHIKNTQPLAIDYAHGSIAVGHNGNLTNSLELRESLEAEGSIFATTSDTEVLVHLIARSKGNTSVDRIAEALSQVRGAYSITFLTEKKLVAARDPHGFRPLCLGKLHDGYLVASEPPAFELIGGSYLRDVEPGEMVVLDESGVTSLWPFETKPQTMCIFEYVYFARPDARLEGISVYEARKRLGRQLAKEQPADVDVVIPVPDSGLPASLGFAEMLAAPFELGLIRSHYVGRTFIEPQQSIRNFGVRLKLHPVRQVLQGKRVAVIDDSVVRGTTSKKIVRMLREAGAKEVHLRISSPPTRWPCFYGIDTPTREELIAAEQNSESIGRYVEADSMGYLSIEGLHAAVPAPPNSTLEPDLRSGRPLGFCDACFSGEYPVAVSQGRDKRQLRLVGV